MSSYNDPYTQLQLNGARWYDGHLGRWTAADTIVPDPGNPQTLNRYTYVGNRPLVFVDPTGHVPCVDQDCNYVQVGDDIVLRGPTPRHAEFQDAEWEAILSWSEHFDVPPEFTAAVVAAEVLYDTSILDRIVDPGILVLATIGILGTSNLALWRLRWADNLLESSQDGLFILDGKTFGPGIGQVHAATAMAAEEHFGDSFPVRPETASERHLLLVLDDSNIMYVAAILRMYADERPGSRDAHGQMSVNEMGAVFANYHEDVGTAFESQAHYAAGGSPTASGQQWVDQLSPLVWYYWAVIH